MSGAVTHETREQWSSQYGFLIAAIGSAVGLGNIWRFPGVAYENGGGAFIIPYLVALLTAGIPFLLLDYSLGHRYRGSAPAAFRRVRRGLEPIGWFQVLISLVIATYYAVVLTWAIRYVGFSVNEAWGEDPVTFFLSDFLQVAESPGVETQIVPGIFWPAIIMWVVAFVIMVLGVRSGLEWANKVFMPLLVVLFLALVVRALFLPGAVDGLNAFFTPNWGALADGSVWIAAYGQIFFTLSVAFGIMLTYSSYLPRRANIAPTGMVAAFANCSFELLAGIGVFATLGYMSAVANVGIDELPGLTGPILSFGTFPEVISLMPGGPLFGVLFFLSLVLAGFTSLISILQVPSAALQEKFDLSRTTATIIVVGGCGVVSLALYTTTTGLYVLDVVDYFTNNFGIIISAALMALTVAYLVRKLPELQAHLNTVSTLRIGAWWRVLIGVVSPIMLIWMTITTLVQVTSEPYEGYPWTFVNIAGWGVLAFMVVAALVLTVIRWRRPVDDFTPVPLTGQEATR